MANEKPSAPTVGLCSGCNMEAVLQYRYKMYVCEWCLLVITSKYSHLASWCGWCEEKVLNTGHPCDEKKSVEWLEYLTKLK